jgi:hypothetical protein
MQITICQGKETQFGFSTHMPSIHQTLKDFKYPDGRVSAQLTRAGKQLIHEACAKCREEITPFIKEHPYLASLVPAIYAHIGWLEKQHTNVPTWEDLAEKHGIYKKK